ncbi:MAG: DNA polymerase I [Salinivirgaceae bacterium]|nr:DNA polymerase I [Salinivirgaceae bacterium]MDD4746396.1 DNA polymerase I [Salinivirgaceae bacterium]
MTQKRLFLIDAYALIYRSYFAFIKNPRMTTTGINTSAVFGFANTLFELLKKENPNYMAIGFDLSQPTFRHTMFPDYKAHRDETPEGVKIAIPYVRQFAKAMGIPIIEQPGYEADDVIGTIAKRAAENNFEVFMMTPDKDYGQLVDDNIKMYKPKSFGGGFEVLGKQEICEKYGISDPLLLIEILALWGDTSDNIPGVKGVGEKTAAKLITEYGSIEGIYENIDNIKGKLRENLIEGKKQLAISKTLVTIITDVETPYDLEEMKIGEPDMEAIDALFTELEFRNLRQRLVNNAVLAPSVPVKKASTQQTLWDMGTDDDKESFNSIANYKTLSDFEHDYVLIDNRDALDAFLSTFTSNTTFSFDTETTGLDAIYATIVGVSLCAQPGKACYISTGNELTDTDIVESIRPLLENEMNTIIGQNLKYDLLVLRKYNLVARATLIDTMLAHYLIEPEQRHNIDFLALNYLQWQKISTESILGKKGNSQLNMSQLSAAQICDYACEDADVAFRLWEKLKPELEKHDLMEVFNTIEMPLVQVLVDMEFTGVKLDVAELGRLKEQYQKDSDEIERKIFEHAGYELNIASPKQLGELLFARLKITDKPKLTKTKQFATGEEVLSELRDKHPIVNLILDYRELQKLLNTYIDALPKLVDPKNNRIHTSYNQAVTSTGRLSSTNPNLQNIPIRDARGKAIRKAFIPSDEQHVLLAADYSQIELRIMAHLSQDTNMVAAFENDKDIHQDTAAKLYGIAPEEVTREQRGHAKGANFGIIYGISSYGLANNTGLSNRDAKQLIDNYFITFPHVKAFMDSSIRSTRDLGFAKTIMGRKRFLPDIRSANAVVRGAAERNAINAPIQGSSADMIKLAMVEIHKEMKMRKMKSRMILQVHDELVFDTLKEEGEALRLLVEDKMLNAISLNVKLKVDINTGNDWLQAH